MSAAPPNPALTSSCIDAWVASTVLVIGFAALLLLLGVDDHIRAPKWPLNSLALRCFCCAVIGGVVGYAELVSRYRDAPWKVTRLPAASLFIAQSVSSH